MRCAEFERVLQRQLDGDSIAIENEALREHALRCDSCRELQEGTRLLMQCFESDTIPPVPIGLTDRVCAASSRMGPRFPKVHAVRWLAAAVAFGAVGLGIRWLTSTPDSIVMIPEQHTIQL